MDFFHPISLGVPRPRTTPFETNAGQDLNYETWREKQSGLGYDYDTYSERVVFSNLRTPKSPNFGLQLVLGEPGAGKSTLLRMWHERWISSLGSPRLGQRIPVLVRAAELESEDWRNTPDEMADRLWVRLGRRAARAAAKGMSADEFFDLPLRLFSVVWLLDGLDEAPTMLRDRGFWTSIRALPGEVVTTCRTAVFQSLRSEMTGLVDREYHILGLVPEEQNKFLEKALRAARQDPAKAGGLVRKLNENPALRPLATIPMMLRLIATAADRLILPYNRAGFYEEATNALWHRRLADQEDALYDLADARDETLAKLAGGMSLDVLDAPRDLLQRAGVSGKLRAQLRRSGLLQFDDVRLCAGFPHLTFQEYYLARFWLDQEFATVLQKYWADPRYEEVLGLLIGLHWGRRRAQAVEESLRVFIDDWRSHHQKDPKDLWRIRRSPYGVVLALLARAGVSPTDALMGGETASAGVRRKLVNHDDLPATAWTLLAHDPDVEVRRSLARNIEGYADSRFSPHIPSSVIEILAKDADDRVRESATVRVIHPASPSFFLEGTDTEERCALAKSAETPSNILLLLAGDDEPDVRASVAGNHVTSPEILALLANDPDGEVRGWVAGNPMTPPEILSLLATDSDSEVRGWVAGNAATPTEVLIMLAEDIENEVRGRVAGNIGTPANTLELLAMGNDVETRGWVAGNFAAPSPILAVLAKDPDRDIRIAVAGNFAAPSASLAVLAGDTDGDVRVAVAGNFSTPSTILAVLAKDACAVVRREVALNPAVTTDVLRHLATDASTLVRREIALNDSVPSAFLASFKTDRDTAVRGWAAANLEASPDVLASFSRDFHAEVRIQVANNPSTPPSLLAILTKDRDVEVRKQVAKNQATPADSLRVLACDSFLGVREMVAYNYATPSDVLATLVHDKNNLVREAAVDNRATMFEDIWDP